MNLRTHIKQLLMTTGSLGIAAMSLPAAVSAAPVADLVIDEVIVTAQKREENVQQVPIAVSVYSSRGRDVTNVKGIEEIAAFTPGVSYSSLDRMSIRGIGRLTNALGSDPGVATYNDGFYNSSLTQAGKSQFFVERVEVLRGPQGTLYGRNSTGGAVNVISKRPSTTLESEVRLTVGDYNSYKFEGGVSGPITERVRFRMSAQTERREEGYINNISGPDLLTKDRQYAELQLEADLTENLNAWIKYSQARWGRDNSDGAAANVLVDPYSTNSLLPPGFVHVNAGYFTTPNRGNVTNPGVNDPYTVDQNFQSSNKLDYDDVAVLHLTWNLGAAALKYIGGYSKFDFELIRDFDATSLTGGFTDPLLPVGRPAFPDQRSSFGQLEKYYSNELNLTSTGEGPLKWIVGLYQYHENNSNPISLSAPDQTEFNAPVRLGFSPLTGPTVTPVAPLGNGTFISSLGQIESDSYAGFAQLDYSFSEHWRGTLGLRYSQDRKQGFEMSRRLAWSAPPLLAPAFGPLAGLAAAQLNAGHALDISAAVNQRSFDETWNGGSGRVGVQWLPTQSTMYYFDYSRGYKAGGFNLGQLASDPKVEQETVDAFELGAKLDVNQQLQFNSSVFYYLYNDAQLPVTVLLPTMTSQFFNVPRVTSYGAEFESVWLPTSHLRLAGSYSYLHARVTDSGGLALFDPSTGGTEDVKGNSVPQAPENKLALNGSYRFDFSRGSFTLSGTYTWQDDTTYSIYGSDRYTGDAYGRADARLIWDSLSDRYSIILFGENLANELGANGAAAGSITTGAQRTLSLLQPRSYGLEVQMRF
jgi:iron complex outermembrane receptor protein